MRLSEAMRLGAMMNPQGFINDPNDTPESMAANVNGERTCALHAACRAVGCYSTMSGPWPWINDGTTRDCPQCGDSQLNAMITVIHLNDYHHWTREQIADWVETIEPAQEQPRDETVVRLPVAVTPAASEAQK